MQRGRKHALMRICVVPELSKATIAGRRFQVLAAGEIACHFFWANAPA